MSNSNRLAIPLVVLALTSASACSKEPEKGAAPAASASASAAPAATAAAPASASASAAPAESAAPAVHHDCPKGSTGEGSLAKPCEAKGATRLMDVAWTGKSDDKGAPQFRVTSKAATTILWGKVAVYFYDKAGKQLDAMDTTETPPKPVPFRTCSGKIFGGVMKPAEKAVISFSCLKKEHVPEGATAIEAEMQMVGFADAADEKKVDFYWRDSDLTPDARKKGGIK